MKVLVTAKSFGVLSEHDFDDFKAHGYEIKANPQPGVEPSPALLKELISDVDGIAVGNEKIDKSVFEAAKNLKVIAKFGVGVDNIDLEEARKRGVKVTNVRGANAISVAEHAFGLMLDISKLITSTNRKLLKGNWKTEHGCDVYGKTLGIIGFGKIGQEMAKRAIAFGMTVIAYDEYPNQAAADAFGVKFVSLDELTRKSDYISLHCPKTAENANLFNVKRLAMMKEGSYLINAARGGLVDEEALYDALESGHLAGAAMDVLAVEPMEKRSKLLDCVNFVLTPHCAGVSKDAVAKVAKIVSQNIVDVLEGNECPNIVK